jgi:hypothetical protein
MKFSMHESRRFGGERWWGGHTIRFEEGPEGWFYAVRRDMPGEEPEGWRDSGGPFPAEQPAFGAASPRIIERERRRSAR